MAQEPVRASGNLDETITAALAQLAAECQPDGSFKSDQPLTTPYHTTAKMAEVAQSIPAAASVSAGASALVTQRTPPTVEPWARRLFVSRLSETVAAILARQNTDRRFGSDPGLSINVLETGLALMALRLNGQPGGAVVQDVVLAAGGAIAVAVNEAPNATTLDVLITALVEGA